MTARIERKIMKAAVTQQTEIARIREALLGVAWSDPTALARAHDAPALYAVAKELQEQLIHAHAHALTQADLSASRATRAHEAVLTAQRDRNIPGVEEAAIHLLAATRIADASSGAAIRLENALEELGLVCARIELHLLTSTPRPRGRVIPDPPIP